MLLLWLILTSALSVIAELCLGHLGIAIPLTAMTGFYLTVAFTWKKSLLLFLASCVLLDLGFGRPFPVSWLLVPYAMLLAQFWRQHGNTSAFLLQFIPGLAIGLGTLATSLAYTATRAFLSETPGEYYASRFAFQNLIGAICLMPFLTRILDSLAKSLSLRCYSTSLHYLMSNDDEELEYDE